MVPGVQFDITTYMIEFRQLDRVPGAPAKAYHLIGGCPALTSVPVTFDK
jgi:hypothetical protein